MPSQVKYLLSLLRANAHYMDVTIEVEVPDSSGELRLSMPIWTPGHYMVEEFSGNVGLVTAHDIGSGAELKVEKVSKSSWRVKIAGKGPVRVEYPVYAFSYTVDDSYIDGQHAIVNGASVFLYPEGMKDAQVTLQVVPPKDWKVVSTGLTKKSEWEFIADNYDILVDSPMEVGNQAVERFDLGGTEYEVSIFGTPLVGRDVFVQDMKKIVEATVPIIDHVPYKRYVFIVNFTDGAGGGLEHLNSTVCLLPRFRTLPQQVYNRSMSLFSHEFFHAWNVKRMKPAGLIPFDYSREMYTKSLWIAEGITSYYDDLIVRRAGIYSVEEYLDALAVGFNIIKSLPGVRHQSAEESSFDTWIKLYRPNENSPNVTSSYYYQGTVIGWMLDMAIRDTGKGNLDDVMKKVYRETYLKGGRGYTDEEFEQTCLAVGGDGVREIFESRVRGREEVDFQKYLGYAGLRLEPKDKSAPPKGFLGVKLASEGGRTVVKGYLAGSPAESMGLSANDEVIGLDGMRITQEKLSFYAGVTEPGKEVKLTVARNGKMFDLSGKLGMKPTFEWRIQPHAQASDKQKGVFKGWMLADWSPELKYTEFPQSPDRRVFFDYV